MFAIPTGIARHERTGNEHSQQQWDRGADTVLYHPDNVRASSSESPKNSPKTESAYT
jgi:hypothetical protein